MVVRKDTPSASLLALLLGLVFVLFSPRAALALAPAYCSSSSWTSIPFKLDMAYWKRMVNPPLWVGYNEYYQSNIHWYWPVLMSSNINQVRFRYKSAPLLSLVDESDWFAYQDNAGWHPDHGNLNNSNNGYSPNLYPITNGNRSYSKLTMEFDSGDDQNNEDGVWLDNADVKCDNAGNTGTINLEHTHEIDVILLGTGDTVYFNVTVPPGGVTAVMNAVAASSGADFDLFASTTTNYPNASNYQWRGYSSQASEAFWIPYSTSSRTIYFTVNSYSGKGHVRVHVTPLLQSVPTIKVCTHGWNANSTEYSTDKTLIVDNVKRAMEIWFGMTDGQNNINQVNLYLDGTESNCDIWLENEEGRSTSDLCGGSAIIYRDDGYALGWNETEEDRKGSVIAHEMGHLIGCLGDEYYNYSPYPAWCGHSIMGHDLQIRDMCGDEYHGLDYQEYNSSPGDSDWSTFANHWLVWTVRTGTPDPSDFLKMVNFNVITPVVTVR